MNVRMSGDHVILENFIHFDLDNTLDNGQCFRWDRVDTDHYVGVAMGRVLEVERIGPDVHFHPCDLETFHGIWVPYFDLDRDYRVIHENLEGIDPSLDRALAYSDGMRLLRQDPWETTVSFIISANNNILRIRRIVRSLSERFGEPLGEGYYAFPTPERLAEAPMEELRACGLGYRDRYVKATALAVAKGEIDLDQIGEKPADDVEKALIGLSGIGPKVAQCILLFAYGFEERVPVDTWIQRIVAGLYAEEFKENETVGAFFKRKFGRFSGYAQQVLFHWARHQDWERG